MDYCDPPKRKINPREKANLASLLTFWYTLPLFKKAFEKELDEGDLYEVTKTCCSKTRGDEMEETLKELIKNGKKPTVLKLLWPSFARRYFLFGGIHLLFRLTQSVLEPHAISTVIGYFKEGQTVLTKHDAYYWSFILMLFKIYGMFHLNQYLMVILNMGVQMRTGLSSLIYRKALKLTPSALVDSNFGNITTLITKDVQIFQNLIWVFNNFLIYTIQAVMCCILLYLKMGKFSFIGIGVMLLMLPLQIILGLLINKLRLKMGHKTDERLQITQETLSAIRIIKMYTWETYFSRRVTQARKIELSAMMKGFYLKIVVLMLGILGSKISFYALISVYLWLGENVSIELIFYIVTIFNNLKWSLGFHIPMNFNNAAEMFASFHRINVVLAAEDLPPFQENDKIAVNPKLELKGVYVKFKSKDILRDINLSVTSGLTVITGDVGSSKSALLKTMFQDYPSDQGHLATFGRISYASQDPWLFPSSVKQNILFGNKFDQKRYEEVIRVCALQLDFNLLDNGDRTIVSDNGKNLSKGQQARINLARAVYRDSEIYLLDDSLTALDAHVQDHIFTECIKGFLKNKLVVLVTQSPAHLAEADHVIVMHQGTIKYSGKPSKMLIEEIATMMGYDDDLEKEGKEQDMHDENQCEENAHLVDAEQAIKMRVYHEQQNIGSVNIGIYHKYLVYGGGYIISIFILILFFSAQYTESYSDKLLSGWTDYKQKLVLCNETCNEILEHSDYQFNYFTIMLCLSIIISLIKSYLLLNFARVASLNIHKAMTKTIINAVMNFFDSHFIGNIINRFSQDLYNIDEQLPTVLTDCFQLIFSVSGIVILLATLNWTFFMVTLIFFIILFALRKGYMPTGRDLKRLEAATRSPLLGHLNASLEGLTTIRAFKQQDILRDEFDRHQDLYTSANFALICSIRAFSFFIDFFCLVFICVVVCRFLFFDAETSGIVGLALTQVFMLTSHVQWAACQLAELENLMTSVERAVEYTEIQSENTTGRMPKNWPNEGVIKYNHVSLTYHNTHEKVLKDLYIEIDGGQKIGIVGRTGAGKSSIVSTLFRLHDIDGTITIDGIDIKTVQLNFLRQSIAIIPQDPVLFTGTVRSNIDPLGNYPDQDIWEAIRKVKVHELVPSLDYPIAENDNNFSSGQKQLICLARAIVRNTKIVVLDEATANMDPETDALLHDTIKRHFENCTVLTIAHRLHSIIECDRVLVLDRGHVVEYDSPKKLLDGEIGMFYKMVKQSGLSKQKTE